jgi:hypothetical protein
MSCPYLTQVTMVFCRASPVKKLVPSDRITTASTCEGECFHTCPLYLEVEEQVGGEIRQFEAERLSPFTEKKGALP